MLWPWLAGCTLHFGTPPSPGYAVVRVDAPVAEPDVDVRVRAAVEAALAARGASGTVPISLQVERASWSPSRREGDVVVYLAELRVRLVAGSRSRASSVSAQVPAPADAALARQARAEAFAGLAERAAVDGVTWLLYGAGG